MKTTYFPCVKGTMGDWTYYVTVMGVAGLAQYVHYAEEICPNAELDKMIQRKVTDRAKEIAEYLRTNDQRFFGSLIVAAYDGQPRFLPIGFSDDAILNQMEGDVGVLLFDGTEQYYALDGQHRLAALKAEMENNSVRYQSDKVPMIVLCHTKDDVGLTRARRLFTTVNRYAKKTSPAIHTAMSEDDGVAIVTRRLIRTHPLFKQRIKVMVKGRGGQTRLASGNAMSSGDRKYLMAIETFRKCNQHLLPEELREEFAKEQQIPRFESLERAYGKVTERWDKLIEGVAPWKALLDDPDKEVGPLRTTDGGHVLARPIGITAFVGAFSTAPEATSIERVRSVVDRYQKIGSAPWNGVLWNSDKGRMTVTVEAEKLARRLWRYLLGMDEEKSKLEVDWRAMVAPGGDGSNLDLPLSPV